MKIYLFTFEAGEPPVFRGNRVVECEKLTEKVVAQEMRSIAKEASYRANHLLSLRTGEVTITFIHELEKE